MVAVQQPGRLNPGSVPAAPPPQLLAARQLLEELQATDFPLGSAPSLSSLIAGPGGAPVPRFRARPPGARTQRPILTGPPRLAH